MEIRSSGNKPVEQIVAAIQALDLDPIKVKLMDAEEGQGWTREYADAMETAYKRFLILLVKYPETTIAPSKEIDKFWHAHILDTMKYAEDCQQVFGYFLHHFPYFGLRGADDAAQLVRAGEEIKRLHRQEFGEAMSVVAGSAHCMASKPATSNAHCMAAKSANDSAHCMAAKSEDSAHCMAARPVAQTAHCMAAKSTANSAHCMAATPAARSAHCMAATPSAKSSAHCMAAKPSVLTRPTLALAA